MTLKCTFSRRLKFSFLVIILGFCMQKGLKKNNNSSWVSESCTHVTSSWSSNRLILLHDNGKSAKIIPRAWNTKGYAKNTKWTYSLARKVLHSGRKGTMPKVLSLRFKNIKRMLTSFLRCNSSFCAFSFGRHISLQPETEEKSCRKMPICRKHRYDPWRRYNGWFLCNQLLFTIATSKQIMTSG